MRIGKKNVVSDTVSGETIPFTFSPLLMYLPKHETTVTSNKMPNWSD